MNVECHTHVHCENTRQIMEAKKSKKPLMEKLRRARINDSLNELKCLVLEAMKKDASRYSKMEKADVLEMTVKYLKSVQERPKLQKTDESLTKYRAGFNECAAEVTRYLMTTEHINPLVRTELLTHLANSLTRKSHCYQETPITESKSSIAASYMLQTSPSSQTQWGHARPAFPATLPTQLLTPGNFTATVPSPPSSPHEQDKISHVPAQQILLGGGIPAFIVPSDAFQLLPLTIQHSSTKALEPWRPW